VYNHVATTLILEVVGEDTPLNEMEGRAPEEERT
jgi:hypothetical protein